MKGRLMVFDIKTHKLITAKGVDDDRLMAVFDESGTALQLLFGGFDAIDGNDDIPKG